MDIGIIGGTKGLGKTLASYFKRENFNITITGRDKKAGIKTAQELNVEFTTDNDYVASKSDILIIAVPIANTVDVIKDLADKMKKESVMIDVTSVKTKPTEAMKEYLSSDVEFIPTHPIFGPRTPGFEGQVIVLTPTVKGKWYPKIYNFLKKHPNKNLFRKLSQKAMENLDFDTAQKSMLQVNDFNGLLIPINDVKALSEAISYMIEHYKDYDRKLIAEDCRQRFSEEVIAKKIEKIFKDVIAKTNR